jgi:hypothetical protein
MLHKKRLVVMDIYYTRIWPGNLKEKDYLEDKGVD